MIRGLALWLVWPGALAAQVLTLPGNATLDSDVSVPLDSYDLPTGPWSDGAIPATRVEGAMTTQVWRVAATDLASLQLLRPLRDQLRQAGYEIIFECDTQDCGGFDFRFGTKVVPPPTLQIDLSDFRFLSATRGSGAGTRAVSLLVSRTPQAGFVQIIRVVPADAPSVPALTAADDPPARARGPVAAGDLAQALDGAGHVVLDGVTFQTGDVTLGEDEMPVLQHLADYMAANPVVQVSIVGHTDSQGGLEGNIAISRRRAAAVIDRLVTKHGVDRRRLTAAGMGYLAPVASNLNEDGRAANRRVEAVVTGPIE
ncbi:OmpA family protein [Loktanella atrilutea]|uniref:OmpA family protein n=1 Tax=Loktanella atrilutea TaxID=366533 RepID=A0A1M4SJB6_LOKAT|nr:OmpA family protein [Loktanella atrilutea]SHE32310.1 OmpA family protein [Loktanella atrilutea]